MKISQKIKDRIDEYIKELDGYIKPENMVVCARCGNPQVYVQVWIDANTQETLCMDDAVHECSECLTSVSVERLGRVKAINWL